MSLDTETLAQETDVRDDVPSQADNRVTEALKRFLRQNISSLAGQPFDARTPLLSSGLLDSLAILQLVAFLADELGVEVGDEDFTEENFATLGALLALVARKGRA